MGALVLTRKVGQTIVIGEEEVQVTVVKIGKTKVRLKINAPKNVRVMRKELVNSDLSFPSSSPEEE